MRTITLKRLCFNDDGTYGVFIEDKIPFMNVLEESWRDNAKGISCIPEGTYTVKRYSSPKHPDSWQVMNVPTRDYILIHTGNTEADIEGCLLLGMEWGTVKAKDDQSGVVENQPAVIRSKEAFAKFQERMNGEEEFRLIISWC